MAECDAEEEVNVEIEKSGIWAKQGRRLFASKKVHAVIKITKLNPSSSAPRRSSLNILNTDIDIEMTDRNLRGRRGDGRPVTYRFGEDQGNALRGVSNHNSRNAFTFQNAQTAPQFPPQQFQAQLPRGRCNDNYRENNFRGRARGGYASRRGARGPRQRVSDRPLLQGQREPTPEQMEGMNDGAARFKVSDDISDSTSEDEDVGMDLGTGDESVDERANNR